MENVLKLVFAILLIGLAVSAYLVYVSFNENALFCPNTGLINCATVLSSSFSRIFGVPLSFYAFAWFSIAIAVTLKFRSHLKLWSALGMAGLAYSVAAMAELGKICIYCSILDIILLLNFVILLWWSGGDHKV
ncbi:MAG: vitamin K epoxide reductase family protein [Candidatus Micrarchaeaceae archaeon]